MAMWKEDVEPYMCFIPAMTCTTILGKAQADSRHKKTCLWATQCDNNKPDRSNEN